MGEIQGQDEAMWRHLRHHAWSEGRRAPDWPAGVQALSREGLLLFGLDHEGQLYWDGTPVEIRRRLDLTMRQRLLAGATAAAVIVGGLNGLVQAVSAGTEYGCKHGWWTQGCAVEVAPVTRPVRP